MRRSGKTTRLVDEAIQQLFEVGNLYLPTSNDIQTGFGKYLYDPDLVKLMQKFIDPDFRPGNQAQLDFIERVNKRLESEHYGVFERVSQNHFIIV